MREWVVPDEDMGCDGEYYNYQELIRCKDCVFKQDKECTRFADLPVEDDDFCSKGEKE